MSACRRAILLNKTRKRKKLTFPGQIGASQPLCDLARPSSIRTIPSTPEFHRIMWRLYFYSRYSWVITTDREFHPAPKAMYIFSRMSIKRKPREVNSSVRISFSKNEIVIKIEPQRHEEHEENFFIGFCRGDAAGKVPDLWRTE